jgi:hypothetical protein
MVNKMRTLANELGYTDERIEELGKKYSMLLFMQKNDIWQTLPKALQNQLRPQIVSDCHEIKNLVEKLVNAVQNDDIIIV